MSSTQQTAEQQQIRLINQLSIIEHNFQVAEQTIILYDLFSTLKDDKIYLQNLHTIAQVLLDKSLKIKVEEVKLGHRSYYDQLTLDPQQISEVKIIKEEFKVQDNTKSETSLCNIFLYQAPASKTRVVVIPIQKDLTDISKLREEQEKLEQEDKDKKKEFSDKNLQYDDLKNAQTAWDQIKKEKFKVSCQQAKDKHLKMFRIEAFVGTILQKTKTYSICSLVEVTMRRYGTLNLYLQKEFIKIFNVPKDVKPQFIFYNYDPEAPSAPQAKHELVTTRLQTIRLHPKDDGKFIIGQLDCFNPKYFYEPKNVRTQIYENMEKSDNKAINKVIQDFVDTWNSITVETASCIGTVVKLVCQDLNKEKNSADGALNNSSTDLTIDLNYSMQKTQQKTSQKASLEKNFSFSFQQIFKKYIGQNLQFHNKDKLEQFYTDERLGSKIKIQKGYPKIPSSIECLVFIHFFYKLTLQFSQKYRQTEISSKNDQIILLNQWKKNLKELYQLAKAINKTLLNSAKHEEFYCKNIARFFDFLMFTFQSSEKIKKITKRDIATASSLKSLFEQFRPKKDRLLSFIIANEKGIKSDEPIHYYDLYLLIIRKNASKDIQNDLQYIQLHIHELKAFRIATQYIWDNEKLVQAIKSYAYIALKYEKLNEKKRQSIDILQIQKRMARLLKIVGQEQFAADIYFKNRDLFFANNCCKQVLSKYKGDGKAILLIKWGEKFEKEFEYDLANSYYLMAFSYAKSIPEKQNALAHKMNLLQRRSKLPSEDDRAKHDKFIKDGNLIEFSSQMKLGDIFKKLSRQLTWDNISGCSVLTKPKPGQADLDQSVMYGSMSELPKSPESVKS